MSIAVERKVFADIAGFVQNHTELKHIHLVGVSCR